MGCQDLSDGFHQLDWGDSSYGFGVNVLSTHLIDLPIQRLSGWWQLKYFLFSSLFGDDSHFLKPPTSSHNDTHPKSARSTVLHFSVSTLDFELKNLQGAWRNGGLPTHGGRGADDDAGSGALMTTLVADWCPTVLTQIQRAEYKLSQSAEKRAWISLMSVSSRTDYIIMCTSMSSYWRKRRMVPFFTHLDLLQLKFSQSPTPIP